MKRLEMKNCNMTLIEKQTSLSALSSGKIDKYEYLTGVKIFPFDQSRTIEEVNFRYSPLGKVFEKQAKIIEDQARKQAKALEVLKPAEQQKNSKMIENIFLKDQQNNELKK